MILDKFKLDGKIAIVTGSARGLGQAIALGLAEAGADIALVDVLDMDESKQQIEKRRNNPTCAVYRIFRKGLGRRDEHQHPGPFLFESGCNEGVYRARQGR